jgi:hypothetical protein
MRNVVLLEQGKDATFLYLMMLWMRTNKLQMLSQGRMISLETHQTKLNEKYKTKYNQNKLLWDYLMPF